MKKLTSTKASVPGILTYEEYQEKMKGLTAEEVTAFNDEIALPIPAQKEEPVIEVKNPPKEKSTSYFPEPRPIFHRNRKAPPTEANDQSPWYDVVANEADAIIIDLYAKGLTTKDIVNHLKRTRNMDISQASISMATDKVSPLVREWQSRLLSGCYPVVYLDGLHFKVRDAGKVISKVACIALGIDMYGYKEVLGIWINNTEGSKFWMQVLNELENRGMEDVLITCVDGLKGFPETVRAIFPKSDVQSCVVHQIRHTTMFISSKDRDKFCEELKSVYMAPTEDAGLDALEEMKKNWSQYATFLKAWNDRWDVLSPFFNYPEPVKRMVYTTNAIESLNSQFRKVTKTTKVFPSDESLMKLLWLAQADISEKWKFPIRNWGEIMAQLMILFPDRIQF